MKIVISWSTLSGYMAACWRALAARSDVEIFVIAHASSSDTAFDQTLLKGVPHRLLKQNEALDSQLVEDLVIEQKPDVIMVTGWFVKTNRTLANSPRLREAKFIMGVDTPWRHEAQFLNLPRLYKYFRKVDHVFVTGERSWQHMRRMGFPHKRIHRGMYGIDYAEFSKVFDERIAAPWPKSFLFIGRYVEVKAIDTLVEAYRIYRKRVEQPWSLTCCGKGTFSGMIQSTEGVKDLGFVQPNDMPSVFRDAGAFVIPSRFDPWPLALVEAAASGLPIIASDACGSAVECVRDHFNGFFVPVGDPESLVDAMLRVHESYHALPLWGERSRSFASAYASDLWAERLISVIS